MSVILEIVGTQSIIIAVLVFTICVFATQMLFFGRTNILNLPPRGPREWPVLGCVPSLIGDEPQKILAGMASKYGPVFYTRIGMIPTLVLSDYNSIREAFVKSGDDFSDRPRIGMIELITKGRGVISAHVGESQQEKRRFGLAALRSLGMGKSRLVENILEEIKVLSDMLKRRKGKPFDPSHDLTLAICNIVSWILFGKRFRHDDVELEKILHIFHEGIELSEATGAIGLIPALQYLPLPVWRKLKENERQYLEFINKFMMDALQRPDSEEPCFVQMYWQEMQRCNATCVKQQESGSMNQFQDADLIGNVLNERGHVSELEKDNLSKCKEDKNSQSKKKSFFNEEELHQFIGDFFVAGTDTSATTISWAILYLVLNPVIQRKVHEELDAVIGQDRLPTLEDRKFVPYTEAVLLEVQRAASIVPLSVPHSTPWDTKLFDYDIPKGTLVLPNIWAVHYDPNVWENPERFLNEDQNAVVQRDELIPFSLGRRKCLGEQLARMELFLFFTHLLHSFEFNLPEGAKQPSLKGRPGATRTPMPYEVCAIPRM